MSKSLHKCCRLLALTLLSSCVFFVLLNFLLFVFFWIKDESLPKESNPVSRKYGISLEKIYPDLTPEQIDVLLKETWSRPLVYDSSAGFKEEPYTGKYVNVDTHGFRMTRNQGPWPPNRERHSTIFLFGGSTVFNYGVPDHQTIASYLQEFISAAGLGKEARVYNFGGGYYFSTQERILFEKLIKEGFIPDIAIFIDGFNDFHYSRSEGEPQFTNDKWDLFVQMLKKLPVTRSMRWMRDSVLGAYTSARAGQNAGEISVIKDVVEGYYDDKEILEKVIDRYIRNKKMIEGISSAVGTEAIFVWQPVPTYKYDLRYHLFSDGGFGRHTYSIFGYPLMAEFAKQNPLGDNFFWCADLQEQVKEPLYVDKVHYSAKLSKMLARCIFDLMRERNFLAVVKAG